MSDTTGDIQDESRQARLPAEGETDLDETGALPDDTTPPAPTNRIYQDDLDYTDEDTDPIIEEETDNPADDLGIPEDEYRDELNKYADDGTEVIDDDMREALEDRDEQDDNAASAEQ